MREVLVDRVRDDILTLGVLVLRGGESPACQRGSSSAYY
jgi:hypothetical protein